MKLGGRHKLLAPVVMGAGLAVFVCAPARAELEYGVEVGAGHTDNVFRTTDNEVESTIGTVGLDVTWSKETRRLNGELVADLNYNHYFEDGIDDQLLGNADGQVVFGIVPDRVSWLVQDTYGQVQQDPLSPPTPESLEFINYFTTGPNFMVRLGDAMRLQLAGRYSAVTYEDSPFDNTRTGGSISLVREVSERSRLSLNLRHDDVDYDEAVNPDVQNRNASVSYGITGARTEIDAEAGYTWVERDVPGDNELTGPLLRLEIRRQVAAQSYLNLRVGTQIADAADTLRSSAGGLSMGGSQSSGIATAETSENKFATLTWQFNGPRTSLDVSAEYDEDEYETNSDLDRERTMFGAAVTRHLTNRLRLRAGYFISQEEYVRGDTTTDEKRSVLGLVWNFGRNVGSELSVERLDRESNSELAGGDSVENRAFLTVFFRPPSR
jgi:hypothetical protein